MRKEYLQHYAKLEKKYVINLISILLFFIMPFILSGQCDPIPELCNDDACGDVNLSLITGGQNVFLLCSKYCVYQDKICIFLNSTPIEIIQIQPMRL